MRRRAANRAPLGRARARRFRGPWSLALHSGWRAIERVEAAWRALFAEQPEPLACQSWESVRSAQGSLPDGAVPLVASVRTGESVSAMLALRVERWFGGARVRWLGDGLIDRAAPMIAADAGAIDAGAVLKALAGRLGRGVGFELRGLPPGAAGGAWLARALAPAAGWRRSLGRSETVIRLGPDWPRVVASLSLTFRRAAYALPRESPRVEIAVRRPYAAAELAPLFELARSVPMAPRARAAFARRVEAERAAGRLRFGRAALDGRPLAGCLVWVERDQAVELFSAFDTRRAGPAATAALRMAVLEHLVVNDRVLRLHLRAGSEPWDPGFIRRPQEGWYGAPYPGLYRLLALARAQWATWRLDTDSEAPAERARARCRGVPPRPTRLRAPGAPSVAPAAARAPARPVAAPVETVELVGS